MFTVAQRPYTRTDPKNTPSFSLRDDEWPISGDVNMTLPLHARVSTPDEVCRQFDKLRMHKLSPITIFIRSNEYTRKGGSYICMMVIEDIDHSHGREAAILVGNFPHHVVKIFDNDMTIRVKNRDCVDIICRHDL